jgi:hypothetical protein
LSELLEGIGFDVVEIEDEESETENILWGREIVRWVAETARQRGWDTKELALLLGRGDPVLAEARTEMFPDQ